MSAKKFKFSDSSIRNMRGLDRRIIALCMRAIELTPVDFGIPKSGGKRTVEQQFEQFKNGKSKCDGVKKRSRHQDGMAVDFFPYVEGRTSYTDEHCLWVALSFYQASQELGTPIVWGGWWGWDKCHIALPRTMEYIGEE
jgi:peptidoglycan L-alanyl-D-glutamate endopeptidase CwlK